MNYRFEYIDIILLAMIAGFIFLRLRGILGKKSGFEDNKMSARFAQDFAKETVKNTFKEIVFNEDEKKNFLLGAKIAYENIVTSFSSGNLHSVKQILDKKVYNQFEEAIKNRKVNGEISETTFIGINSAKVKNHENNKGFLEVTVNFASEIISCVKDKNNKILSGDPKKIKKVFDTWKFSRNIQSTNPNWLLIDTECWLKKITNKDKKDWKNFTSSNEKVQDKDDFNKKKNSNRFFKTIDLHGYPLDGANKKISEFIEECYIEGVSKISIITGKGSRSKNKDNPFLSSDLAILKHSVPYFLKNNPKLMKKIIKIDFDSVNSPSHGSFDIFLKNNK